MTELNRQQQAAWLRLCHFHCILAECCRGDNWLTVRGEYPLCLVWRGRKAQLEPEAVPDRFIVTRGGLVYRNGNGNGKRSD